MYERRTVEITLADTAVTLAAAAYVVKTAYRFRLQAEEWDYAYFLQNGKAQFRKQYMGYKAIDGSREESEA